MRIRSAVLCAAALVLAASPAYADHGGDRDCADFTYQEEAQAHMDAHSGDPDGLDADNDGRACESLPSRGGSGGGGGGTTPVGGVDAGAGGSSTDSNAFLLLATGAALGAGGAELVRRGRRTA